FRREIRSGHSLRLRAAAIAGLASFGDAEAAGEVRSLLAAPEPEIRLAAVQALGRCGRGSADLEALAERLDSGRETNQGIRDRVWESYTAIARRASPQAELKAAGRFATPADPPVQRRRLSLLRALKRNPARFGALTPGQQVELLDALSEAQLLLEEYDAASTSIDEAMKLLADAKHPTTRRLGRRLVAVLLRLGRDKEALERLQAFQSSGVLDGVAPEASPPIEIILSEARRRLAAADDAGKFAALLGLIDLARPIAAAASQPTRDALEQLEQEALDKRRTVIERLLGRLAQESDAEGKLIGFGRDLVLPGVRARLSEQPTTSAPAGDLEQALIALAKKLVPGWPGFAPGGPPEARAAALEQLRPAASASQPAGPG
ncbi:MAG: HEAT repeat domain-containing protein, partial [Phycisphaerae bacterium]